MFTATAVVAFFIAAVLVGTISADVVRDEPEFDPTPDEGLAKVSEEELSSKVPPRHMRCDACAASAFWIHRSLNLAHKEKYNKKLSEDLVIDTIDEVCLPKTFSRTYGIKNLNGRHRLSGGGLKAFYKAGPAAGTAMPGQWINYQCRQTQGEYGEDELYKMFWKYHVTMGLEKPDAAMFVDICVRRMKKCSQKEAIALYDGLEPEDLKAFMKHKQKY